MAKILYGAPVREQLKQNLIARVKMAGRQPTLAIVQVGDRPDSNIYIRNKANFGQEIGVRVILEKLETGGLKDLETKEKIIRSIERFSEDKEVDGIIVQLPLPQNVDVEEIVNSIPKSKDADGLVSRTVLDTEDSLVVTPATARAVLALLDHYEVMVSGKRVAVIGRSKLAGGPIAQVLRERGGEVTVCHRGMEKSEIMDICKKSDILVSAAGEAGLVTKDFVNEKQVVVDVGINQPNPSLRVDPLLVKGRERHTNPSLPKIVGDVAFAEVEPLVAAITPVPGGVGPLTVACLFENLLDLIAKKSLF